MKIAIKQTARAATLAIGALLSMAAQASPMVSFNPSSSSTLTGDNFSIDVNISGLSATEIVSVFDFNIYFDSTVLKGVSWTLGTGLGGLWEDLSSVAGNSFDLFALSVPIDPSLSQTLIDDALAALQADGDFTLVTLTFEALNAGVSQIGFGNGSNERVIVGRDAADLTGVDYGGACVAVNSPAGGTNACTVPEPSSYALVGLGLFAAFAPCAMRRRKTA
ncbi:cohesin domain-containing protein [Roseateles sp.]|uniref:cohesin domain-containing protein n=1 Tax=Roseateles sp. TaxID=1971397 RepID=UPI00286B84FA|nr:cohesin domain-containing protein [Roseateles sp.]